MKIELPLYIRDIALDFAAAGGKAMLVGGMVRDAVMATHPRYNGCAFGAKDIDIEVYGLGLDELEDILRRHGKVSAVGQSFMVLNFLRPGEKQTIDFSLPRRETKTGDGHKGFEVEADSKMTFKEAASRRDFTMNAIGYDILTGELQDPYDGQSAIAYGLIKHTSEKFSEDPLRVLRAVQFASRFGMSVDADTAELCREQDLNEISAERIESEIYKWAKGGRIDMGMIAFERCCFPDDVSDVVRYFYTERIVTDHTVNSVAFLTNFILRKPPMAKASPMVLNLAAIVIAANMNDVEHDGRVHGWLQKNFSESLTVFRNILDTTVKKQVHDILKGFAVLCLNEDFFTAADYCDGYLDPMSLYDAYRKTLDIDWKPVSDEMPLLDKWRFKAPEKLLTGKELVGMGFPPGPQMGEILSMCRELQRRGYITTKEEALTWASKKKS